MENNKAEVKSRNGVIIFLIVLVLVFATAFVATSVYVIREKKSNKNTQTQEIVSFSSLTGKYVGNTTKNNVVPSETEVSLYLYEDGSFHYYNKPGLASGVIGYYTFNDNEIVLHGVVGCANDIGRTVISDSVTIKINDDKSLTDSELDTTLKKSSDDFEKETNIISTELKAALNMDVLD